MILNFGRPALNHCSTSLCHSLVRNTFIQLFLSEYHYPIFIKISEERIINSSSPSRVISVPAYLPYNTISPAFCLTGIILPVCSAYFPGPTATTVPFCGFSLAVSGIIIPPAVLVSAAAGFTSTRSSYNS